MSPVAKDEIDLTAAISALERGRQALAYAHGAEVKQLGREQRRNAQAAAAAILTHAVRFVADVVARNGGPIGPPHP